MKLKVELSIPGIKISQLQSLSIHTRQFLKSIGELDLGFGCGLDLCLLELMLKFGQDLFVGLLLLFQVFDAAIVTF